MKWLRHFLLRVIDPIAIGLNEFVYTCPAYDGFVDKETDNYKNSYTGIHRGNTELHGDSLISENYLIGGTVCSGFLWFKCKHSPTRL